MPKLMSDEVLHQLLARIEEHIAAHSLADFPIVLHGGMSLLLGIKNFRFFAEACEAISWRARCEIPISVTTNGVLIDDEWLDCLEAHGISVAISLDGPAISTTRIAGPSSVMALTQPWNGPRKLVSRDIGVIALAVCNPAHEPEQYADFFASCGISNYDIIIPDATADDSPPPIASFYNGLFDL